MYPKTVTNLKRRLICAGIAGIPLAISLPGVVRSQDNKVDPGGDLAKSLSYTVDGASVPASERGGEGNLCANCLQFTEPDAEWGPCKLFPGKVVHRDAWCKGWVKRA